MTPPFLLDLLRAEGIELPEHVLDVQVDFSDGHVPVLRLAILLSPEDVQKIARALVRFGAIGDQGVAWARPA